MQIFTSLLLIKNPEPSPPVWPIPMSRNVFGVMRCFGLGFSNLLKEEKMECGIDPRADGGGGGWGGSAVAGGGRVGLKTA